MTEPVIRESTEHDLADIERLYPAAFPDEDLLPLVRSLLVDAVGALSLVATVDDTLIGHAILTPCSLTGSSLSAALLGPVAVAPTSQRQGIGRRLIESGLQRMGDAGTDLVLVLGDPAYYRRFGFTRSASVMPPYPLPPEWADAWQMRLLGDQMLPETATLSIPAQWNDPALWSP